jgi:hypothetical protein
MRIQLDLQAPAIQLLDALKRKTGLKTYKDLFNNALTLLSWAITQRENGFMVCSVDKNGTVLRELHMPVLEVCSSKGGELQEISA